MTTSAQFREFIWEMSQTGCELPVAETRGPKLLRLRSALEQYPLKVGMSHHMLAMENLIYLWLFLINYIKINKSSP